MSTKILVAVKQVAALDADFEIRADGKDVDADFLILFLLHQQIVVEVSILAVSWSRKGV